MLGSRKKYTPSFNIEICGELTVGRWKEKSCFHEYINMCVFGIKQNPLAIKKR